MISREDLVEVIREFWCAWHDDTSPFRDMNIRIAALNARDLLAEVDHEV